MIRKILARPALHGLVAALFFLAFVGPLFVARGPSATWLRMYGAWAVSLIALFLFSFADDSREE